MVPSVRKVFNETFTDEKYNRFLHELDKVHPGHIDYRIAETPIFCDKVFTDKMIAACESIVDVIVSPNFKELTAKAIPAGLNVPNENAHTHFIAFDFGICENEQGGLEPQLIEMQGFPSLFAFQDFQAKVGKEVFVIPDNYTNYLNGFDD